MTIAVRNLQTAEDIRANARRLQGVFFPSRQVTPARVGSTAERTANQHLVAASTPEPQMGSGSTPADVAALSAGVSFQHPRVEDLLANYVLAFSSYSTAAPRVTLEAILNRVSAEFRVGVLNIKSERRCKVETRARHAFCYLAKELTVQSFPAIARFLGGRDHTTVMNSVKRAKALIDADADYRLTVLRARSVLEMRQ